MKCKTTNEVLLVDAIAAILRDLPAYECQDFHHAKKDQHKGCECPVMDRFDLAIEYARNLIA